MSLDSIQITLADEACFVLNYTPVVDMPATSNEGNDVPSSIIVHQERQSIKPPIQQSQPIPIMSPTGKHPVPCVCPYCRQSIITRTEKSNGLLVWLASAGICLLGCALGCCLIPFFIDDIKDTTHFCPNCNRMLGRDKRL